MRGLKKTAPDGANRQTHGYGDSMTNFDQRGQVGENLNQNISKNPKKDFFKIQKKSKKQKENPHPSPPPKNKVKKSKNLKNYKKNEEKKTFFFLKNSEIFDFFAKTA